MRQVPWTPRDFLIEDLVHITPTLYYHYPGAVALMTVGMEIEQKPEEVETCLDVGTLRRYKWDYDASGPLETALPPKITYVFELKKFFEEIEKCNERSGEWFEWKNEWRAGYDRTACGSHLHFRPREDIEPIRRNWVDAWRVAYDTIFTVSLIILPVLCFGAICRKDLWGWAEFTPNEFPPINPEVVTYYLRDDYEGHPYAWLAWNRHYSTKPLTLELRVFEGYPGQALLAISILQKAVKVAIHNNFTPVLFERDVYEYIWKSLNYFEEQEMNIDVFELLEKVARVTFREGHWLPYIPRRDYENMLELFREVLFNYTTRTLPYMRVASLLAVGGNIKYNYPVYWQVFTEDRFCWQEPEICDEEIKEMFSSSDRYWATIRKYGVV
jgi:hypothetical protein